MEGLSIMLFGEINTISRSADIVLIIDTTKSMRPIIKKLQQVGSWWSALEHQSKRRIKKYKKCRFKVIWFRNFHHSGKNVYGESKFFDIFNENEEKELIDYLNNIEVGNEENFACSALESLYMAMNSDFNSKADKSRYVFVLITDKPAHPLEQQDQNLFINYTFYMPQSIKDFYYEWDQAVYPLGTTDPKLDIENKRLILVAPDVYPWNEMFCDLDYTVFLEISPNRGGIDLRMEDLLHFIDYALS